MWRRACAPTRLPSSASEPRRGAARLHACGEQLVWGLPSAVVGKPAGRHASLASCHRVVASSWGDRRCANTQVCDRRPAHPYTLPPIRVPTCRQLGIRLHELGERLPLLDTATGLPVPAQLDAEVEK